MEDALRISNVLATLKKICIHFIVFVVAIFGGKSTFSVPSFPYLIREVERNKMPVSHAEGPSIRFVAKRGAALVRRYLGRH